MATAILDFDKALKVHLVLRQGDHYERVFAVKKNGVDYDWAGVVDVILQVKKNKGTTTKIIELKESEGGIEIGTGYMTWNLGTDKTDVAYGDYSSLEVLLVFTDSKPKTWIDGDCKILQRGIQIGGE